MNIVIFDTETSGIPSSRATLDDPCQPYILQLGYVVIDENFKEINSFVSLINNHADFPIESGAFDAHHITHDMCNKYGIDIDVALSLFYNVCETADKIVAFNLYFDKQLIEIAQSRSEREYFEIDFKSLGFCAMLASTPICQIKYKDPKKQGFKWPKLKEAYEFMYKDKQFNDGHDALRDVRKTTEVLKYLVQNKHCSL